MGKTYFKSDGNGGFHVSKNWIAIMTLVLTILSSVVASAVALATTGIRVDHLEDQQVETTQSLKFLEQQHTSTVSTLSGMSKDIEYIKEKVDENHEYIKDFIEKN